MVDLHHYVGVNFARFKAFDKFSLQLRHFNILVGPNNAGKSTILTAFRILAAALRRANTRSSEPTQGPQGQTFGYPIDLAAISIAEENIFYNYDDREPAIVRFKLSNDNELILYFPERGVGYLIPEADKHRLSPSTFRSRFNCPIGFVPILGPVEHNENLYDKEAARLALFNYRAARNFRNIWYHYPEKFDEFRLALIQTWPGMDIERPEVDTSHGKPRLHMFCPEERIPREIFWSGFGFQVWCQMLTHLIQSNEVSLFMIDEPDIYLHSDLQRQLLSLLRNLGPDILIATHSTEIISEAETDDIILVNKRRNSARRIRHPSQLQEVFSALGSNLNPILTQLAKTRRVLFLEGKDFQILGRFARKLGFISVGNRSDFAVVPVDGFNPERIRSLKIGMETTLGARIFAAAILDRDFRSDSECEAIVRECKAFCDEAIIYERKEIENFLLVPSALDRAAARRVFDQAKRAGREAKYAPLAARVLEEFSSQQRSHVAAQVVANRRRFIRSSVSGQSDETITERAFEEFEASWQNAASRLKVIGGKEALSQFNSALQREYGVSVTPTSVIEAMNMTEIATEMRQVIESIAQFSTLKVE